MSTGQLARHRSSSSGTRPVTRSATPDAPPPYTDTPIDTGADFEPCAATASHFLFTQDSSIICLHHDTLAVDRRFEKHRKRILFLSVDNVSEQGAGRLVVSYDEGQTAIVWDLFTGDEVARFASYEPIRVAAWMRNGNVAFGRKQCCSEREGPAVDGLQATNKATSFYLNHVHQSMYLRGRSSTLSQLLRRPRIVKYMPSG